MKLFFIIYILLSTFGILYFGEQLYIEQEKNTILIQNYLSNIHKYRQPLWNNNKDLNKFKENLRIWAIRNIKQRR